MADNVEAYYILVNKSHALVAYSLTIIKFNGSGGSKADQNARAGIELCKRAASLGHWDAIIELAFFCTTLSACTQT
ncbi:hypothetical protein V6N11_028782 [Hibiscus sabdariffa]|uniref:Uncharacterized protein n=1 Tax=Hibiscus sabdariffa TaxID=183260 RepID=A0ABR2PQT9_9ROSI